MDKERGGKSADVKPAEAEVSTAESVATESASPPAVAEGTAETKAAPPKRSRPARPRRPVAQRRPPVPPPKGETTTQSSSDQVREEVAQTRPTVGEHAAAIPVLDLDATLGPEGAIAHNRQTRDAFAAPVPVLDLDATLGPDNHEGMRTLSVPFAPEKEPVVAPLVWKAREPASPNELEQWLTNAFHSPEERANSLGEKAKESAKDGDKRMAAILAHEAGAVWEREISNIAAAAKWYAFSLKQDPQFRANLWAIRRIFYRRELWPNLTQLLRAEINFTSGSELADLWLEKAAVEELNMADLGAARDSLTAAMSISANEAPVYVSLERVALKSGDSALWETALRGLIASTKGGDRRIEYALDLARLLERRGEFEKAWETLVEAEKYEREPYRLARAMERVAQKLGDQDGVLSSLKAQARLASESFGDSARSSSLWRRHALMCKRKGGEEAMSAAWGSISKAVEEYASDISLHDYIALATELGKTDSVSWAEAKLAVLSGASLEPGVDEVKGLHEALLAGEWEAATELEQDVASGWAPLQRFALNVRLLAGQGDFEGLVKAYTTSAKQAETGALWGAGAGGSPSPALASRWFVVAGDLAVLRCKDEGKAELLYRAALVSDPNCVAAMCGLASLLHRSERCEEAIEVLTTFDGEEDSDEKSQRLAWLARFQESEEDFEGLKETLTSWHQCTSDPAVACWLADVEARDGGSEEICERIAQLASQAEGGARVSLLWKALRVAEGVNSSEKVLELCDRLRGEGVQDDELLSIEVEQCRLSGDTETYIKKLQGSLAEASGDELYVLCWKLSSVCAGVPGKETVALDALVQWEQKSDHPTDAIFFQLSGLSNAVTEADANSSVYDSLVSAWDKLVNSSQSEAKARALFGKGLACELANREEEALVCYLETAEQGNIPGAIAAIELGHRRMDLDAVIVGMKAVSEISPTVASELSWLHLTDGHDSAHSSIDESVDAALAKVLRAAKNDDPAAKAKAWSSLASKLEKAESGAKAWVMAGLWAKRNGDSELAWEAVENAWSLCRDDETARAVTELFPVPSALSLEWKGVVPCYSGACARRADNAEDKQEKHLWYRRAGDVFLSSGDFASAKDVAREMLVGDEDSVFAYDLLRKTYRKEGDEFALASVKAKLASLVSSRDNSVDLLASSAAIFEKLGKTNEALEAYTRLLTLEPERHEYERTRDLLVENDRWQDLFDLLGVRAEQLSGKARARVVSERGRLRYERRELQEAERDLSLAFELDPNNAESLLLLADVETDLGHLRKAVSLYGLFLEKHPMHPSIAEVAEERAELLLECGEEDEALEQLRRVVELDGSNIGARSRLVDALVDSGLFEEAIAGLGELEGMRANNQEKVGDMLRAAGLARRIGRVNKSETLLLRAQETLPTDDRVIEVLVSTAEGKGGREKVWTKLVSDLRAIVGSDGTNSIHYEYLARAHRALGNTGEERHALGALAALEPLTEEQSDRLGSLAQPFGGFTQCTAKSFWDAVGSRLLEGKVGEVWKDISPRIAVGQPESASDLGFAKSERVRLKDLDDRFPRLAEALRSLDCSVSEIFVSAKKSDFARVLGTGSPVLCLASNTASMDGPLARYRVGWALAQVKFGMAPVVENSRAELEVWVAAAAKLAGIQNAKIEAGREKANEVESVRKALQKLPRRVRKKLEQSKSDIAAISDVTGFWESCLLVCDRAGLALSGDVTLAADISSSKVRMHLLAWSVGHAHASLAGALFEGKGNE